MYNKVKGLILFLKKYISTYKCQEVCITDRHVIETEILGESVRLSSDASEERLYRISECINEKAGEIQKLKRGLPVSTPLFKLLVNVNLADDLISAQEELQALKSKNSTLEKDLVKARRELREHEKQSEKQHEK